MKKRMAKYEQYAVYTFVVCAWLLFLKSLGY